MEASQPWPQLHALHGSEPATLDELKLEFAKEFRRLHSEFRLIGMSLAELHEKVDELMDDDGKPAVD